MAAAKLDTWMPLYIGDYLADTMHLSTRQHGAYLLLIFALWRSGEPLVDDDKRLAAIAKETPREWKGDREVLEPFFIVQDGTWRHKRVDIELERTGRFLQKQRQNGSKGGRPRKNPDDKPTETQKKPTAKPKAEPSGNPNESTHNHSYKEDISVGDRSAHERARDEPPDHPGFEEFEDEGPRPIAPFLARQGVVAPQAQPIGPRWLPSEEAQQRLVKAAPHLTPERIRERTTEFLNWCAETNKHSHNPDATWLNFMVKTHVKQRSSDPRDLQNEQSAEALGIAAAFARRRISPG